MPQSLEAEQSTLGAMIIGSPAIAEAVAMLHADDFYRNIHSDIFMAVVAVWERAEPVDLVTVCEELRRNGKIEEVGGAAYLHALIESCPSSANIEAYAEVVRDKAVARKLILVAEQIGALGYGEADSIEKTVDRAEQLVYEVGNRQVSDNCMVVKEALLPVAESIIHQLREPGGISGLSTGFPDLDKRLCGMHQSELIIIGARPAGGKCESLDTVLDDPVSGARKTLREFCEEQAPSVRNLSLETGQQQTTTVTGWMHNGVRPVFCLTTQLGRTLEVTSNHPFLTVNGWVQLSHRRRSSFCPASPRTAPGRSCAGC